MSGRMRDSGKEITQLCVVSFVLLSNPFYKHWLHWLSCRFGEDVVSIIN